MLLSRSSGKCINIFTWFAFMLTGQQFASTSAALVPQFVGFSCFYWHIWQWRKCHCQQHRIFLALMLSWWNKFKRFLFCLNTDIKSRMPNVRQKCFTPDWNTRQSSVRSQFTSLLSQSCVGLYFSWCTQLALSCGLVRHRSGVMKTRVLHRFNESMVNGTQLIVSKIYHCT